MKKMTVLAIALFSASLASCAVWHDRTVERTSVAPVAPERTSASTTASTAAYQADYPRDQRRADLTQGGAGGAGGSSLR